MKVSDNLVIRLSNLLREDSDQKIRIIIRTRKQVDKSLHFAYDVEKAISILESADFKTSFLESYEMSPIHILSLISAFSVYAPVRNVIRFLKMVEEYEQIERVEESIRYRLMLNVSTPLVRADKTWSLGFTGKNVKVAVVDSGIDDYHPDLKGRVIDAKDYTAEGLSDNVGHGTHIAGIIAGGGSNYRGIAPDSKLLNAKAFKLLDRHGEPDDIIAVGESDDIAAAMEWAYNAGADVFNLSFGGPGDPSDFLSSMSDAIVSRGRIVVVSAGNEGPKNGTIGSPGCAKLVITVGAIDKKKRVTDYSSRGPCIDGGEKPDVVAPGGLITKSDINGGIISALSNQISKEKYEKIRSLVIEEKYISMQGTSFAAPHVSGAVALMIEAVRKENILTSIESLPHMVKHAIKATAEKLGYDKYTQGYGLINVEAATMFLLKTKESIPEIVQEKSKPSSAEPMYDVLGKIALTGFGAFVSAATFAAISEILKKKEEKGLDGVSAREIIEALEALIRDYIRQLESMKASCEVGEITREEYELKSEHLVRKIKTAMDLLRRIKTLIP
ncbi:MAG: S8 family serine peptidase [Candidatus Bathyarchaeia archaeon]